MSPSPERWRSRGSHRVRTAVVGSWCQADGADVPVFAQWPATDGRPLPVVVLCHGLGGDHRGYAHLGEHLASHGYAVLHPQFADAFAAARGRLGLDDVEEVGWERNQRARAAILPMLFDPEHWLSRVSRVHSVLDSLPGQPHLAAGLAGADVVVAGHSYGAYTAQLLLGTRLHGVGLDGEDFGHPSVAGGILMSPQGSGDRGLTSRSWDAVSAPLLVITATHDLGARGQGLSWRREPFDAAPSPAKYLAVVRGGDHLLGGIPAVAGAAGPATDPPVRSAVSALAVAFADRLHGDGDAADWLASHPLPDIVETEHRVLAR